MKLDWEHVGVIAAIWQWGHFVGNTIESVKVLSRDSEGIRVEVRSRPGFNLPLEHTLTVRYPYFGDMVSDDGRRWSFIVGNHGLEFREVA